MVKGLGGIYIHDFDYSVSVLLEMVLQKPPTSHSRRYYA